MKTRWWWSELTREKKEEWGKNMGKSAFKRFNSIHETINIVYLSEHLLPTHTRPTRSASLSPCVCRMDKEYMRFCLTLNEFHINCFWHFCTNAPMHEQKTRKPVRLRAPMLWRLSMMFQYTEWGRWIACLVRAVSTWTPVCNFAFKFAKQQRHRRRRCCQMYHAPAGSSAISKTSTEQ